MRPLQLVVLIVTLLFTTSQSISAAPSEWQGPRPDQEEVAPAPQVKPAPASQPGLPDRLQNNTTGHPQTREVPATQALPELPKQPELETVQPELETVQPNLQPDFTAHLPPQSGPAYLGLDGKTAPACRYPAGVRVTQTVAGSPADQAGLTGETKLTWKKAAAGLLSSPLMPFVSSETERTGSISDLILAVDGKRVRNTEELKDEMGRFRPGDLVYMSVLRNESQLRQVPVRLQAYPDNLMHQHTREAMDAAQAELGKSVEAFAQQELEKVVGKEFSDMVGKGLDTLDTLEELDTYDLDKLARGDVESFVRKNVKKHVRKEVRERVGKRFEPLIDRNLHSRLDKGLEALATQDLESLIQEEIETRVEREIETRLENELETRLKQEIDPQALQELETKYQAKFQQEFKRQRTQQHMRQRQAR